MILSQGYSRFIRVYVREIRRRRKERMSEERMSEERMSEESLRERERARVYCIPLHIDVKTVPSR
jgi:hypothetical protein